MSLADVLRAATSGPDGTHLYLSTACLHGEHEHCRSSVNADGGTKTPGTCKFCAAVCACIACDHSRAVPPVHPRPVIHIDPAMDFGRPQIKGVTTGALAGRVMGGDSVNDVADDYNLSRHEVLLACWHEGIQGEYRREWSDWANAVHRPLGDWEPLDVDALPDPPCRDELAETAG